jgi:transcription initiation factor TFIIB
MSRDSKLHVPIEQEQPASKETAKIQVCPECGSTRLMRDYEAAEIVCMDCGIVVQQKIADRGPEWRAFDDEQRSKRTRVGAPLT